MDRAFQGLALGRFFSFTSRHELTDGCWTEQRSCFNQTQPLRRDLDLDSSEPGCWVTVALSWVMVALSVTLSVLGGCDNSGDTGGSDGGRPVTLVMAAAVTLMVMRVWAVVIGREDGGHRDYGGDGDIHQLLTTAVLV